MSGQKNVTPSVDGLAASLKAAGNAAGQEGGSAKPGGGLPPVHLWNPPFCGDLDIRIASDGRWFHEGGEIRRVELVRLFASILKREGEKFFLVTPVEKVGIRVEDAPFIAVDVEASGQGEQQVLRFTTQLGDEVTADAEHPLRVEQPSPEAEPAPYVMIRSGLEARIDRKSFYRLVELGCHHEDWFGLWSGGAFFRLLPSADLA
ncbi:DUF1285 domain-containing protein [Roseobacter sp. SK209-2-6]|uniref:DUF1285 domain-containing protein n=1 Tax=Roseobacter sp. SK209-2-6 TaxID=388739 RepID=UPI0003079407|nr:DUF1285 domain-containing protein [Roseobacter sp. SK209-2-6]